MYQRTIKVIKPENQQAYSRMVGRPLRVGEMIELDSRPQNNPNQYDGRSRKAT